MPDIFIYNDIGDTIIGLTEFGKTLTDIEIPLQKEGGGANIIAIGDGVTSVLRDSIVRNITFESGSFVTTINDEAFNFCTTLETIILPQGLKTIGIGAFTNTSIKTISLPQGLETIDSFSFSNCYSLISINIPSSITNILGNPFTNCNELINITTDNNNNSYFYIDYNNGNGCILYTSDTLIFSTQNIRNGYKVLKGNYGGINIEIKLISTGAFSDCKNLSSIILPDSLILIAYNAFRYCISLSTINIPSSVSFEAASESYYSQFAFCPLTSITTNGTSTYFDITSSNNGNILYTINDAIVIGTINLSGDLIIDFDIKYISELAFYNCTKIKSIILPKTLEIISSNVFENCISLQTVTFLGKPPLVFSIDNNIFNNCNSLKIIYYLPENSSFWSSRPSWIPNGVKLLPLLTYFNKTIMYTTPKSLNFIITQNNKIFKLQKNILNTSKNYSKTINNLNLNIISQILYN